ncbi:MAG: YbgC/FadM family acyl-CoA thioesterase [Deltaproteobacteria bacterium]|nr:YbgC/FadM family acyl-CoA thioesterase [Deltaproteobacteria bacterium]
MDAPTVQPAAEHQVTVYYEDTDALGVVYYANYLRYLERGRSELFADGPAGIARLNQRGILVAVYAVNLKFLAPARLGDLCTVRTRTKGGSAYRIKLDQQIWRDDLQLVAADVDLVCVDRNFELQEFPEDVLERFGIDA